MKRNKNLYLLIVFVILLSITIFFVIRGDEKEHINIDEQEFVVEDTSSIQKINFYKGDSLFNSLEKRNNVWFINNYKADENLPFVLLTVFKKVKAKRALSKNENTSILDKLKGEAIKVKIIDSNGEVIKEFYAGGNPQTNLSWFYQPGSRSASVVAIPGYSSFIAGIFSLSEDEWRDKMLFGSNWNSVLQIKGVFPGSRDKDFQIIYSNKALQFYGKSKMDTTQLFDYVGLFENIKTSYLISKGKNPTLDSLSHSKPFFKLELKDIDSTRNNYIQLFNQMPINGYIAGTSSRFPNKFILLNPVIVRYIANPYLKREEESLSGN